MAEIEMSWAFSFRNPSIFAVMALGDWGNCLGRYFWRNRGSWGREETSREKGCEGWRGLGIEKEKVIEIRKGVFS